MTAQIIPFTAPVLQQQESPEQPQPYDFWYWLIEELPPGLRRTTVEKAQRCGVIDERDIEIFMSSWTDVPGFWSENG